MIHIVMLYKTGGDYTIHDVNRLACAVRRNITVSHRVYCLTDDLIRVEELVSLNGVYSLRHDLPGWWSKMELFKINGPILYFDLDTVITGNIDELAHCVMGAAPDKELLMLRDFYRRYTFASGILGWNGNLSRVFDIYLKQHASTGQFISRPNATVMRTHNKIYRGDQEWLRAVLPIIHPAINVKLIQDAARGIYSYKAHVVPSGLSEDACVVCFHGKPRPTEVNPLPSWMEQHWSLCDA